MKPKKHNNRNVDRHAEKPHERKLREERRESPKKKDVSKPALPSFLVGAGFGIAGLYGIKSTKRNIVSDIAQKMNKEGQQYTESMINDLAKGAQQQDEHIYHTAQAMLKRADIPYKKLGPKGIIKHEPYSIKEISTQIARMRKSLGHWGSNATVKQKADTVLYDNSKLIEQLMGVYKKTLGMTEADMGKIQELTIQQIKDGIKEQHISKGKYTADAELLNKATQLFRKNPNNYGAQKIFAVQQLFDTQFSIDTMNDAMISMMKQREITKNKFEDSLSGWMVKKFPNALQYLRHRAAYATAKPAEVQNIQSMHSIDFLDGVTSGRQADQVTKVIGIVDDVLSTGADPGEQETLTTIQKAIGKSKDFYKGAVSDLEYKEASEKSRKLFDMTFAEEVLKIKRKYADDDDVMAKKIRELNDKYVAGVTIEFHENMENQFFASGKKNRNAIVNIINANGQVMKEVPMPAYSLGPQDQNFWMYGGTGQYAPTQSIAGNLKGGIRRHTRQRDSFSSLLPKFIDNYYKDPYNTMSNLGNYFNVESTSQTKYIHTMYDLVKSEHEVESILLRGVVNPNELSFAHRKMLLTVGESVQDYTKMMDKVEAGKEAKMLFFDTETFLTSGYKSDNIALEFRNSMPQGWRGHAYSISFNGTTIKNGHGSQKILKDSLPEQIRNLFTWTQDPKTQETFTKTPMAFFTESGKVEVKSVRNPGRLLLREPILNLYREWKSGAATAKELMQDPIFKQLQPTKAMQTEEGFKAWLDHVVHHLDDTTVKWKDVRQAMISAEKGGWSTMAYNGMFDARRMNIKTMDALGILHGLGQKKDGTLLLDLLGKTSLGDVKEAFNITENQIEAAMTKGWGIRGKDLQRIKNAHFDPYDTAVLKLAMEHMVVARDRYQQNMTHDVSSVRGNLKRFAGILKKVGQGQFIGDDIVSTIDFLTSSEYMKDVLAVHDYESVFEQMSILPSSGAAARGIALSGKEAQFMSFFSEIGGVNKQLQQKFNAQMIRHKFPSNDASTKSVIMHVMNSQLKNPIMADKLKHNIEYMGMRSGDLFRPDDSFIAPTYLAKMHLMFTPSDAKMSGLESAMNEGAMYRIGDPEENIRLMSKFKQRERALQGGAMTLYQKNASAEHKALQSALDATGVQVSEIRQIESRLSLAERARSKTEFIRKIGDLHPNDPLFNEVQDDTTLTTIKKRLKNRLDRKVQNYAEHKNVVRRNLENLNSKYALDLVEGGPDGKEFRLETGSYISDFGVDENGKLFDLQYYRERQVGDGPTKIISATKGVVSTTPQEQSQIIKQVSRDLGINRGYLSSMNYALRKHRHGELMHGLIMNAQFETLAQKFGNRKVTAQEIVNEINKYMDDSKLFPKHPSSDIYKTRLKYELGLLNGSDKKMATVREWVEQVYKNANSDTTTKMNEYVEKDIDYATWLFKHINRSHKAAGLVMPQKEVDALLSAPKEKQLEYLRGVGGIFTSTHEGGTGVVNYQKYSKLDKPIEAFIKDYGFEEKGMKYLPSYLRPLNMQGKALKEGIDTFMYEGLISNYITEDLSTMSEIITPGTGKFIRIKPHRDIGFMTSLFRKRGMSMKAANRMANQYLKTTQRDLGLFEAYSSIIDNVGKQGLKAMRKTKADEVAKNLDFDVLKIHEKYNDFFNRLKSTFKTQAEFEKAVGAKDFKAVRHLSDADASEIVTQYNKMSEISKKYLGKKEMPNMYLVHGKLMSTEEIHRYARDYHLSDKQLEELMKSSKKLPSRNLMLRSLPSIDESNLTKAEKAALRTDRRSLAEAHQYFNSLSERFAPEYENAVPIMTYKYNYQYEGQTRSISGAFALPKFVGETRIDRGSGKLEYAVLTDDAPYHMQMLDQIEKMKKANRAAHVNIVTDQINDRAMQYREEVTGFIGEEASAADVAAIQKTKGQLLYNLRGIATRKGSRAQPISFIEYGIRGTATYMAGDASDTYLKMGLNIDDVSNLIAQATAVGRDQGTPQTVLREFYKELGATDKQLEKLTADRGYVVFENAIDMKVDGKSADKIIKLQRSKGEDVITRYALKNDPGTISRYIKKQGRQKLAHEYGVLQVSYPQYNMPLTPDTYLDPDVEEGTIAADRFLRKLILKDWDSDEVVAAFAGLDGGFGKNLINRQEYIRSMQFRHQERFRLMKQFAEDNRQLASITNNTINFNIDTAAKRQQLLKGLGMSRAAGMESLYGSEEATLRTIQSRYRGIAIGIGDSAAEVHSLWGPEEGIEKVLFSTGAGTGKVRSFSESLSGYKKNYEAWIKEALGKRSVPSADALAHAVQNRMQTLDRPANWTEKQFEQFLSDISTGQDVGERMGVKIIKSKQVATVGEILELANKSDGEDKFLEQATKKYMEGILPHLEDTPGMSKGQGEIAFFSKEILRPALQGIWKDPEAFTKTYSAMSSNTQAFLNTAQMQQATKTTVADSMSMMLGKYAQGVASQETLRQRGTEMLNKVVSKMKGKEALLIAGAAVAGAILMNPNQTPWFDKNAPGEGGEKYDRQVRWTAEPPVRVYKRDMHLKNKQADRMLSLLDAEKQNIIHSIQQKQSTLSDDRIRDAKGNLLSF